MVFLGITGFYAKLQVNGGLNLTKIHSTAIIDKDVELGEGVEIGAFSVIQGKVNIGDHCVIMDHASIHGNLKMGSKNVIHPGAVLGNAPQDISYRGEPTCVEIGDNNVIREFVTINRATTKAHLKTVIGNNNLIMAYCHIAHDCIIGNDNIMPNQSTLSGHVVIGNHVHTGGMTGIHQFVTVGDYSFTGFSSRIVKDVPPYMILEGNPAEPRTVNKIGLQRSGFSEEEISLIKLAFKVLYVSDSIFPEKIKTLESPPFSQSNHIRILRDFAVASSQGRNGRALEKK
ncbi:MAG TPA: acyl-[acyl-carrier-protein]--UDP-N-acetylglucosamine O-acyltransferase [Fibrobacteres bacterium]|nr:acyl-[acyl-carrier-protein]--UDP-N-acetylglucosamine O-acyltransferase [Fibrobacterota bacterium]